MKRTAVKPKRKRKSSLSPVQLTIRELRRNGIRCGIVERWIPQARKRKDLFNIIDIIALDHGRGVVGVQVTTGSNLSSHVKNMTTELAQDTLDWLQTPGTVLEVWGWRKVKVKRGGKKEIWSPKVVEIKESDIIEPKE